MVSNDGLVIFKGILSLILLVNVIEILRGIRTGGWKSFVWLFFMAVSIILVLLGLSFE